MTSYYFYYPFVQYIQSFLTFSLPNKLSPLERRVNTLKPLYLVVSILASLKGNECELTMHYNGKISYLLRILPSSFRDAPTILTQYLTSLEGLRSIEEEIDGVLDYEVYKWATRPFEPLVAKAASARIQARHYDELHYRTTYLLHSLSAHSRPWTIS